MNYIEELKNNEEIFLNYMKEKYPLFSKSNFFLRDLQYAITHYFKLKGYEIGFTKSESISLEYIKHLEATNAITAVSKNTWRLEKSFEQPKVEEENEVKESVAVEN